MSNDFDNPESSSGRFIKSVQPQRDLQSNWTVDLAKNLQEYLLKICTGEISGNDDTLISVNFAEAALLLQGSVQVYSRKVEYLYSLVLHALNFISQKSQEDQATTSDSAEPESGGARKAKVDEDDPFWGLDDIAVEPKNLLDNATSREAPPSHYSRPPANLVVLEGEGLDVGSDAGELESYLLATNDLYRDFILLDSCDAVAVDNFLDSKAGKGNNNVNWADSVTSKDRKSFLSPSRRSGGTASKFSARKKQDDNLTQSQPVDKGFEPNDCHMASPPPDNDFPEGNCGGFGVGDGYLEHGLSDDSDGEEDDPWKPLDPHEPGNLRVRPYKKVKLTIRRLGIGLKKRASVTTEFPLAKLHGPVSKELNEIWEARFGATKGQSDSQSSQLYEKLRESLMVGGAETRDTYFNTENNTENGYDSENPDNGTQDFEMPDTMFDNEDIPSFQEKHDDGGDCSGMNDTFDEPDSNANLEDLCRSHLDALLANLAETEKQTELASRVSTWKQRIEQNMEEQDARPPFDIHKYGERVMDKLTKGADDDNIMTFGDIVGGQEKHDVARSFSALLQLVNNGDVDLLKITTSKTPICYTASNPFRVKLLKNDRKKGFLLRSAKKRPKSPLKNQNSNNKISKGKENGPDVYSSPPGSCRMSVKLRKANGIRCTPESKRRRKSRLVAPLDLQSRIVD